MIGICQRTRRSGRTRFWIVFINKWNWAVFICNGSKISYIKTEFIYIGQTLNLCPLKQYTQHNRCFILICLFFFKNFAPWVCFHYLETQIPTVLAFTVLWSSPLVTYSLVRINLTMMLFGTNRAGKWSFKMHTSIVPKKKRIYQETCKHHPWD